MLVGRDDSRGFSVVELLVVISLIGILAALSFGYAQSTQVRTRDMERSGDVKALAQQFERKYRTEASTALSGPSYPTTSDVANTTAINSLLSGADKEIAIAPKSSDFSIEPAPNNSTSQSPALNKYSYQPLDASGNLCSTAPCVRFVLYYRVEATNQIVATNSMRQQ